MLNPLTSIAAVPLRGGCKTDIHKSLLPFGSFSMCQNVRGKHPGFRKRPGCIKLHTTADTGTPECISLYQFRKRRIDETHLLKQASDGVVMEATNQPPTVTTGAFGSSDLFTGSAAGTGEVPASYSVIDDIMLYSNGVDQHQTYTGTANYVEAVIVYSETSAAANVPEEGVDYTVVATDGLTTTEVVLDDFGSNVNHSVFICCPVAATSLTWTMSGSKKNTASAVGELSYFFASGATWADTTETDGTIIDSGKTLSGTGTMSWTAPSDEVPTYMYGRTGFWYRWRTGAQLTDGGSGVRFTKITFGSGFQDLVNVWNGQLPYAIEAMHYDDSASLYKTYAGDSVSVRLMEAESTDDNKDRLYFSSFDNIIGIYVDVGSTPNTATTANINGVKGWTGSAFGAVTGMVDGTNGLTNSGWITWARLTTAERTQFKTTQYYAHWYYFWLDTADLSTSASISILTMPYFDIEKLGHGLANVSWKDSAAYSFTNYSNYVYIAEPGKPTALNGEQYGILKAGDGRTNKVVAMRKFHNELLVFQEEKGVEGGSVTNFQGYSPDTWGKLVLSSTVGTFSNKTVDVVDGVMTSTETTEQVKTLCFFLSRYGVCATDGFSISIISDDIQNYFDPTESTTCIRRGYEDKMWLFYDSAFNILRLGLVTGTTATLPNIFPVFDLTDKVWYFDVLAQEFSCMAEVEGSGNIPTLQVGGGTDDGFVYLSNTNATGGTPLSDISTAIDSYVTPELNLSGQYIQLNQVLVRAEAVASSAGDITATFTANTIAAGTKTLSMSPEVATQTIIRHRFPINITDQNISAKLQNNAAGKAMTLLDVGFETQIYEDR